MYAYEGLSDEMHLLSCAGSRGTSYFLKKMSRQNINRYVRIIEGSTWVFVFFAQQKYLQVKYVRIKTTLLAHLFIEGGFLWTYLKLRNKKSNLKLGKANIFIFCEDFD